MRHTLILQLLVITGFASIPALGADGSKAAPAAENDASRAVAIARRTMDAMGGREAFEATRLLRFDFQVSSGPETYPPRHHWWDRFTGAYRLEGTTPEGAPYRVLLDLKTRDGQAWIGERALEGEEKASMLESAYARFINDSYWLLMPWKWLDPGVHLAYEGERTVDGTSYDVVRLTFDDGTGLTSGDRYWGLVSRETGLMERWEYILQQEDGSPGEGPPRKFVWTDWKETDAGIRLATRKVEIDADPAVQIAFPVLMAWTDPGEAALREAFHPSTPVAAAE